MNEAPKNKSRLKILSELKRRRRTKEFVGSENYWENRYAAGGTSGSGSYGRLAEFKAEVLNRFVKEKQIQSVLEFGCGDGNQLSLMAYPKFTGLDVSRTVIQSCVRRFAQDKSKSFFLYDTKAFLDNGGIFRAELALSLDVIYHLVEEDVYVSYMTALFQSGSRYVIVYSSNWELPADGHLHHRKFTDWVQINAPKWKLAETIPNRYPFDSSSPDETSLADFFIFERVSG